MRKTTLVTALLCAVAPLSYALPVKVVGTVPVSIEMQSQARHGRSLLQHPQAKVFSLMRIQLSSEAKQQLKHQVRTELKTANSDTSSASSPSSAEVGMSNVPVLNQGAHGSCVTFANTGAVDAVLSRGDYVSQLCSLALGSYLEEQDSDYPSGWDGSWGSIVLKQLSDYGFINKDNQHQYGCGGLTDYPTYDPSETGKAMSPADYESMSESLNSVVDWTSILSVDDAFGGSYNPDRVLSKVKKALARGERLTFGVGLDVNLGSAGAVGSYHAYHDTWVLTPDIQDDVDNDEIYAGHEMIIIGYDDNAEVTADDGTVNKGLLHLRNSWSEGAGDKGDYYMSYAHFKALTMEVQTVTPAK